MIEIRSARALECTSVFPMSFGGGGGGGRFSRRTSERVCVRGGDVKKVEGYI